MTSASATRVLVMLAVAGSLAGCSAPPPPPASPPAARPLHVTLPPGPLQHITISAMQALVRTIYWQGCTVRLRAGVTPGTTTKVSICAADYARGVGKGNNHPNGIVVGRMINRGTTESEKRFNLKPGASAYIVAFAKAGTDAEGEYAIIEIPAGSAPSANVNVLKENGNLIYCEHPSASTSSADFRRCEEGPEYASRQSGAWLSGPSASGAETLSSLDGPAWLSCRSGCCTTEGS